MINRQAADAGRGAQVAGEEAAACSGGRRCCVSVSSVSVLHRVLLAFETTGGLRGEIPTPSLPSAVSGIAPRRAL